MSNDLGIDRSGNGNSWTVNNIVNSDQVVDSPTNNFCTINPMDVQTTDKLQEGALQLEPGNGRSRGTFAVSTGKWYFEVLLEAQASSTVDVGISGVVHKVSGDTGNEFVRIQHPSANGSGVKINNGGTSTDNQGSVANGNIIGCFFDMDAEEVSFLVNNSAIAASCTGVDFSGLTNKDMMTPHIITGGGRRAVANFGQDSSFNGAKTAQGNQDDNDIGDFYYAPPSGFLALCTKNLPDVAVTPSKNFNTVLYSGNGATSHAITGVGFQTDFNWIKRRNGTNSHALHDSVRGKSGSNYLYLNSNATNAEAVQTDEDGVSSFDSDGFTVGYNGSGIWNNSSGTYVSWNWKANGSGSSNTNGSINTTSTSANVAAGFSISTYTGTGSNATIGHGLSKAPEMIICKRRNSTEGWATYHVGIASDAETDFIELHGAGAASDSNTRWNDTAPTSSVFSIGTHDSVNASSSTYVAYCFHSVDGYSKMGSYIGNGNADGAFVNTGFRPAFLLVKKTGNNANGSSWIINDSKRLGYNNDNPRLRADTTGAEDDTGRIELLSNGFKMRVNYAESNEDGVNFIYMAFAETPFKYSNAR